MGKPLTVKDGYNDTGQTIEITQQLTEGQFREIGRILGRPPERFKGWPDRFVFDPPTNAHGSRLRDYLRSQQIAHGYEKRYTWLQPSQAGVA
ncbi:MAG TPA: hypothetical protein VGL57_13455 [Solirubrobacteraceae bacterium]|jgi:hypothetical protein